MTPLYNGNDYYRKMLDLQERLRKSEEERIRLEERFSLLEHESRSRHETCINRLRMRYIDFLEEQQARDERNHQLLGALDRVDSSLALMTAKTDRLGALRKQYEASLLAPCENRRANGSVTGDSGVASQNDERQRRSNDIFRGNSNEPLNTNRSATLGHQRSGNCPNNSTSQVRPGSSYGSTWSGIRCDSTQMHQPSFAFSRFSQGVTGLTCTRENGSLASFVETPDNRTRLLRSKNSPHQREPVSQSQNYRNTVPHNSSAYDHRNDNLSRYEKSEYPLLQNTVPASSSLRYGRSVIRDLANSGAYEIGNPASKLFNDSPSGYGEASIPYERVSATRVLPTNEMNKISHRNSFLSSHQNSASPPPPSSRSPKLSEILRRELGDEEEYIGGIVENQLERYISKIRSLHNRDAEPQSFEEIDHEQNTSGDLLNVTLSDDGVDFPVEEKSRERTFPRELDNVLALANDLANKTATSAINVANNIYQNVTAGGRVAAEIVTHDDEKFVTESTRIRSKNNPTTGASDGIHQLASINRLPNETELYEDGNRSSDVKLALPAKNGISVDVGKSRTELASRLGKNIRDITKLNGNSRDTDLAKMVSGRIGPNEGSDDKSRSFNDHDVSYVTDAEDKCDKLPRRASSLRELEESPYGMTMIGEERVTDENLFDIAEDLEPWNLSALERRVQELILTDGAHDDYIQRGVDSSRKMEQIDDLISGINRKFDESRINERKIDEHIVGNDETMGPSDSWKNDEAVISQEKSSIAESSAKDSPTKNDEDTRLEEREKVSSVVVEQSLKQLPEEYTKASLGEEENIEETNYVAGDNHADPSIEYGAKETENNDRNRENESYVQGEYREDPNLQYEYNADGQYQGDPNEQYRRYNTNDNAEYNEIQGEQYGYVDQQYGNRYVEDTSSQEYDPSKDPNKQEYVQDPNQQEYVQDPNQQEYVQDPNQQEYVQDPNQEAYNQDPNQREYIQDPNQQEYVQDPNQQEYVRDPNQETYNQDPNQQEYMQDPNQEEYVQDPNQQYVEDPNQQYIADPNQQYPVDPNHQYTADPNQQYPTNPSEEYSTEIDPTQQYPQDDGYGQDVNQDYPVVSTDYPYPEAQEYPNNESYAQGQEGSTVARESGENVHEDPSKVSAEDHRANNELDRSASLSETKISPKEETTTRKTKDVIKSILDSDTESTIERNVTNTESDFDFN